MEIESDVVMIFIVRVVNDRDFLSEKILKRIFTFLLQHNQIIYDLLKFI